MRIKREGNRQTRRVPSRERERSLCAAVLARLGVVLARDRDGVGKLINFAPVPVLAESPGIYAATECERAQEQNAPADMPAGLSRRVQLQVCHEGFCGGMSAGRRRGAFEILCAPAIPRRSGVCHSVAVTDRPPLCFPGRNVLVAPAHAGKRFGYFTEYD